ncbi:MAG: hypothetical protein JXR49_10065 [Acidobacteria bacterium]|nr:hypothetical protein [Acidobacteriota bacterium]
MKRLAFYRSIGSGLSDGILQKRERDMSLYGSIKEVQNNIEKFYLNLEQRFNENKLISDLWCQMAQDVSQQIQSLHDLPKSFWSRLKKDPVELIKTIKTDIKPQDLEIESDISLSECIDKAIQSEEAIILKIYVPLIRNLRKNWTGQALDFYIMVKAHTVRIKRVAEAFSGDPIVMQHATLLFQGFEKEIQEPDAEIIQKIKSARKNRTVRGKKSVKPKTQAKSKTRAKTKLKAEAKPKIRAKAKAKAVAKTKPKPASKTRAKAEPKPAPKTKAQVKSKPKPKAKPGAKVALKTTKPKKQKSRSPVSRSKIHSSRPKPRVEKADVRRRRVRR